MTAAIPDIEDVRAFLRDRCEDGSALDRLEMHHVKLRGDRSLSVLYEGPREDGGLLRVAAQRVDAVQGRRLEEELNRRVLRSGRPAVTGFGQAAMYAPQLDLLFQVFPTDRRLEALAIAADARAMASILEAALARRTSGARVSGVTVHALRYKPERKCLFRYEVGWAGLRTAHLPGLVYGRLTSRRKFRRSREVLPRLRACADMLSFDLPEDLGALDELGLQLFSHVDGVPLFSLAGSPRFPDLCRRVGCALHELHRLPVALEEGEDPRGQAARVGQVAVELGGMFPAQRARSEALREVLRARLEALPASRPRPVHGDFHGDNVLVHGSRLALVDLEDCAMGDPAQDFGLNWAQLAWHAVKAGPGNPIPRLGRRAFTEAYLERADAGTARRLPVHAAVQCFLGAYQCVRRPQDPEPFEDAEILLEACEDALSGDLA